MNRETLELIFLLTAPVVLSFRGVFDTTLFPYTEVSAICYPFFAFLGPYLLWQWLNAGAAAAPGEPRWKARLPVAIVSIVALAYSLVRCIGAAPYSRHSFSNSACPSDTCGKTCGKSRPA